ncbi:MAG TPA: MarR family winged helix-turn-helix transcriptional regulator [Candidatus Aquabacterium excrementipullorum]|nr:MarR family winged helix-turn-helix transcriptional regulator [Candidatus Aquabacterium excrementipullorum]
MPPPPARDEVVDQLADLTHLFKSRLRQAVQQEGEGLAPMEAKVLMFFTRRPGSTASDLALHSGRDKAQVTRLVQLLVDRGLLLREPDPADRRQQRLTPTAEGTALQRVLHRQRQKLGQTMVKGLSADELDQLSSLLRRLRDNLVPPEQG